MGSEMGASNLLRFITLSLRGGEFAWCGDIGKSGKRYFLKSTLLIIQKKVYIIPANQRHKKLHSLSENMNPLTPNLHFIIMEICSTKEK